LEEDKSGDISADGGRQGPNRVQRSGSEADTERNGRIDAVEGDGRGSLAGEPTPIHIQDEGTTGRGLSAGSQISVEKEFLSQDTPMLLFCGGTFKMYRYT